MGLVMESSNMESLNMESLGNAGSMACLGSTRASSSRDGSDYCKLNLSPVELLSVVIDLALLGVLSFSPHCFYGSAS